MDVYQDFCEGVVDSIRLHLTRLRVEQETTMTNLYRMYNAQQSSNVDQHSNVLQDLQNTIQRTLIEHRELMLALSEKCILDALQGSHEIEHNQEIAQIKWHCRQTLIDQLQNIPGLLPTEQAKCAMDDFLCDTDEKPIQFPDEEVMDLIALLNPIHLDHSSDSDNGPVADSD